MHFCVKTKQGGGIYINSNGVVNLVGCVFSGNTASGLGGDVYRRSTSDILNFFSLCPGSFMNAGEGSLDCDGCSGPADLSSTACSPCSEGTFSCCGATSCSNTAESCSSIEAAICPDPTVSPTPAPSFPPSPYSSNSPTSLPTSTPTSAPTPSPSSSPTPKPTPSPTSPVPSSSPSSLPSQPPSVVPTIQPTIHCSAGSILSLGQCALCPAGKFSNITHAPFATKCRECAAGTFAITQGMKECSICQAGKLSSSDRTFCQVGRLNNVRNS
jgi:hypothetical protein